MFKFMNELTFKVTMIIMIQSKEQENQIILLLQSVLI